MDEILSCAPEAEIPTQRGAPSLLDRIPGHAVITELLAVQAEAAPRSGLQKLFGVSPLLPDARPWYWGALGEIAVGRLLQKLPQGWHVLHAVPVGKGSADIDHVVIGPAGVLTINTKYHPGQRVWVAGRTFLVAGQKQHYIRNAEHEAERAAQLLSLATAGNIDVRAVVTVVDPRSLTLKEAPARVAVLPADRLVRWLKKRPQQHTADQVEWVLKAAAVPTTWHKSPIQGPPPTVLQAAFAVLDREVRQARRVRRLWTAGVASVGAASALTVGPELLEQVLRGLLT